MSDIDLGHAIRKICNAGLNDQEQRSFSDTLIRLSCRTYAQIDRDPLTPLPDYDQCIASQYAHGSNALEQGWTHQQLNFMGFYAIRFKRYTRTVPFMQYISEIKDSKIPDENEYHTFVKKMVDHYRIADRIYQNNNPKGRQMSRGDYYKRMHPRTCRYIFRAPDPDEASTEARTECTECQETQATSMTDQIKSLRDRLFNFF